jgi:ATP-binding cassette subfamily F protein uup
MVTHDRFLLRRVCNEIIELDNGKYIIYKGNYSYYLEKKEERMLLKIQVWTKRKIFCKLEWMRRQPARTTKSKSRQDDFYEIKEKAQSRRKENKVELNQHGTYGKQDYRAKSQKIQDHVIMDNFSLTSRRTHWNHREKMEQENQLSNLLTDSLPLDGGKW